MQPEDGKQGHENITDSSSWENVGEIGKRKSGHVAGHEGKQAENSEDDIRIGQGYKNIGQMVDIDGVDLLHATRKKSVPNGTEDHNGENHEILTKRQAGSYRLSGRNPRLATGTRPEAETILIARRRRDLQQRHAQSVQNTLLND
jgi:hypothetical protein